MSTNKAQEHIFVAPEVQLDPRVGLLGMTLISEAAEQLFAQQERGLVDSKNYDTHGELAKSIASWAIIGAGLDTAHKCLHEAMEIDNPKITDLALRAAVISKAHLSISEQMGYLFEYILHFTHMLSGDSEINEVLEPFLAKLEKDATGSDV